MKLPVSGGWRFTFHGQNKIGDEQILAAKIEVDGEAMPTQGQITSAGWEISAAFREKRLDGPPCEVTLVLPWDYSPPSDTRALGVLAQNLSVTPDDSTSENPVTVIEHMTPLLPTAAGEWSVPLRHCAIGLRFDPRRDHEVVLCLPATTSPAVARSAEGFIGGRPVSLRVETGPCWRLRFMLPASLLEGHYLHSFDVVLSEPAPLRMEAVAYARRSAESVLSIRIADAIPSVGFVEVPETRAGVAVAATGAEEGPSATHSEDQIPASHVSVKEQEAVAQMMSEIISTPAAPAVPTAKPMKSEPFAVLSQNDNKIIEINRLGDLSIMMLRLPALTLRGVQMGQMYLKLLASEAYVAIEFRERDGAFQLFNRVPSISSNTDEYGNFVILFSDPNGIPSVADDRRDELRDGFLIDMLAELPEIVASAILGPDVTLSDRQTWLEKSRVIQASMLGYLM